MLEGLSCCRAHPGHSRGLSALHSKSTRYGIFVCVRGALNRPKRRLSARACMTMTHQALGWLADALGWLVGRADGRMTGFGQGGTAFETMARLAAGAGGHSGAAWDVSSVALLAKYDAFGVSGPFLYVISDSPCKIRYTKRHLDDSTARGYDVFGCAGTTFRKLERQTPIFSGRAFPKTPNASYHAFGLIRTALSKTISIFQSSSLKVAPKTPNGS